VTVAGGGGKKMRALHLGDIAPLELQVQAETMRVLSHSMVGIFKDTMDFQAFYERLLVEGQLEVKAIFMGGNKVLLQSSCEAEMKEVMKFNKSWWDQCFSKIIPWQPKLVTESRDIWIQIFGIPLHAWEENSFKRIAGRFGVFLDFDEATIAKQRLDVARVKLRTVRRGMIDTVLQLKVVNDVFDVWVVEERCACGDDRSVETEEGYRSLQKINSESGEHGWKGDDRDLFSDGRSDSDTSEAGKEVLGLQLGGSMQSAAGPNMGVRQIDLESQNNILRNVGESLSELPLDGGQVGEEGEILEQSPSSEAGVGMREVEGEGVGPGVEDANTLQSDGALLADHVWVDPMLVEVDEKSGPIGPDPGVNSGLGLEDQEERELDPILANGHLADTIVINDVEDIGVDDVAAEGGNNTMRISQISESSTDSTQSNGGLALIKKSKKGPNNKPGRPAPPMIGIPKFRHLELVPKAAVGRWNKHGSATHSRAGDFSTQEVQA
jgi:hypothetical protein